MPRDWFEHVLDPYLGKCAIFSHTRQIQATLEKVVAGISSASTMKRQDTPKQADPPSVCLLPPTEPEDIRQWFRSITHRIDSKPKSTELVKRHRHTSFDLLGAEEGVEVLTSPVYLVLKESKTIWLMTILTAFSTEDTDQIEKVVQDNSNYSKIISGHWKGTTAETQTHKLPIKQKECETVDDHLANSYVNASAWDLFDTYAVVAEESGFGIKEFQLLIDTALKSRGVLAAQIGYGSDVTRLPADKQMGRLMKTDQFQYCVLVAERLLASKTYHRKQCLLRKKINDNFEAADMSKFSYDIKWLWNYDNRFKTPLTVTSIDWNPLNPGLLAVAYGGVESGCICIWSPKNPSHAERRLFINSPVTTLCFSKLQPHIAAAGCRNGDILVVDISSSVPSISHFPRGEIRRRSGAIWKVQWFVYNSAGKPYEDLMAIGESGILVHLSIRDTSLCCEIVKLEYTNLVNSISKERSTEFRVKSLSGLWFSLVPEKNVCYVSTNEGVVVKCVIQKPCYTDVRISAHLGPVYVVQHSPATPMLFLTAGADHCVKIWVEGIEQPLLTLYSPMKATMVSAEWSPTLPTVIATLGNNELAIWDLARKPNEPINVLRIRLSEQAFSTLRFFPDGMGIAVGDERGLIRLYQLSQLPRQPFLQIESLTSAIQAALAKKPQLLYKFNNLLRFHKNEFQTRV